MTREENCDLKSCPVAYDADKRGAVVRTKDGDAEVVKTFCSDEHAAEWLSERIKRDAANR